VVKFPTKEPVPRWEPFTVPWYRTIKTRSHYPSLYPKLHDDPGVIIYPAGTLIRGERVARVRMCYISGGEVMHQNYYGPLANVVTQQPGGYEPLIR